jgi:hypothetical protein
MSLPAVPYGARFFSPHRHRASAGECVPGGVRHYNRQEAKGDSVLARAGLGHLRQLYSSLACLRVLSCGAKPPRADAYLVCANTVPGTTDLTRRVRSLDQLYSQALGVVATLHNKAIEWAAAAGGKLDDQHQAVDRRAGLGGEQAAESLHRAEQWIARGLIKRPARAVAKVRECYGGDPSLLADVCRARIVFDRPGDVAACLAAILADSPQVRLRRVKNSMSVRHDAEETAGFRVRQSGGRPANCVVFWCRHNPFHS